MNVDRDAERRADKLSASSRAYLLGDSENLKTRRTLTDAGYLDIDGRLTALGARVARVVVSESNWTGDDTAALDAQVRASRRPKPAPRYADPELADACRKILAYRLKYPRSRDLAISSRESWRG